jgi:hypothetical protein
MCREDKAVTEESISLRVKAQREGWVQLAMRVLAAKSGKFIVTQ